MKRQLCLGLVVAGCVLGRSGQGGAAPAMGPELEERARQLLWATFAADAAAPAGTATNPAPQRAAGPTAFHSTPFVYGIKIVASRDQYKRDGIERYPGLIPPEIPLLQSESFEWILAPYFQQPMSSNIMVGLQREIIGFYRRHGRPLVDVFFPVQDVSNGMLQILVIEAKIIEKRVEDVNRMPYTNGWTKPEYIQHRVRQQEGEVLDQRKVFADLDAMNRNPLRTVSLVYESTPVPAESDLVFRVDERWPRPWRINLGYEDTGSRVTDEDRIYAGFLWAKAFGLNDHVFSYRYTADPGFDQLKAHSASYSFPLPWRHYLRLFGDYVDVTGKFDDGTTLEGTTYQTSMRYEIPLPFLGQLQHQVSGGLDFKSNDNDLLFGGESAVNTPTEIFQVNAGYFAALPDRLGVTAFSAQGYYSPGDVTSKNTDEDFTQVHQGATAEYLYGRFILQRETKLPFTRLWYERMARVEDCFSWAVRGTLQISGNNLLPNEQLGLGGFSSVRGYEEREVNTDEGWILSNEIRTPVFHPTKFLGPKRSLENKFKGRLKDGLQLLAFCDWGRGSNKFITDADPRSHYTLLSVGPGVRFNLGEHVDLRFDYGWQLTSSENDLTPDGQRRQRSRGHLGVSVRF